MEEGSGEDGKVELEREVGDLKHQIRKLLWEMKCSGTNQSNESCENPTTELEQVDLDEIYPQ